MWLWQRKNGLPKELRIWIILCAISGMLHLIFILVFVFGYKDQIIEARITLCKGAKRIVFVDDVAACKKNDVSQTTAMQEIVPAKPDVQMNNKAVSESDQKSAPQKVEKKNLREEKTLEIVSLPEEAASIEPSVQEVAEDIATEHADEDKKIENQEIEKKEEEKNENNLVEQPMHTLDITPVVEKSIEVPVQQQQINEITDLSGVALAKSEVLTKTDIVVLKTDDAQYIEQIYAYAVQRIMENWKAPYGVPADISCTIKASVHMRGHINELDITESSGSYIFDMAARTALLTTAMPDSMRGKSIIITFKQ